MQYQFTGLPYIKSVEFFSPGIKNSLEPLHVERIRYFQEEGVTGHFTKQEFRYSWDNATWSNWNTLTQANLSSISFRDKPNFYLHVKYSRAGQGSANIDRWYLIYDEIAPTPPSPPVDLSINAWWFRGEGPEYFLDRQNHFGPYTDLNVSNVDDGSTAGVYFGREDSSLGTNLYFKRVKGTEGITVEDGSNGIITLGLDASIAGGSVYDSSLDPSTTMPSSVGGIPAGTTVSDLNGDTISSLWDALLFPTAYPTLTAPNNSFSSNAGSLQEIGASINIIFSASFSRGSISPQYSAASPYRSGLPNTYTYTGTGIAGAVISTSLTDVSTLTGYTVISGSQSWTNTVSYDAGVQPYDSKGNPYNSPLAAGTTTAKTVSLEGVYPLFGTTVNISTLTKQTLVSMISGDNISFTLVAESGGNKGAFEIPDAWLSLRSLVGVQTFNTVSNQWEYQGGTAGASLTYWTTSSVQETIQGNPINYTRYTYNSTDRSSIQIRLIF
jgi:hypothetical protein